MLHSIVRDPLSVDSNVSPTLVLLHGLGADEHDLMGLAPHLDAHLRIVSVRAPLTSPWGGYSWFDIDFSERGMEIDQDDVRQSFDLLTEFLQALPGPRWLAGFSQGAMMTLGIAVERPDLIAGAIALSGAFVPLFEPAEAPKPPIFLAHGTYDPVVPVQEGRRAVAFLAEIGVEAQFHEYEMEHEINAECLNDLKAWLTAQTAEFTKSSS